MWPKARSPALTLLLLTSPRASATNGKPFYSSGSMDPCPNYPLLNTTSLAASFTPSNGSLAFSLGGVRTISGHAGLSVGLVVDEVKKYDVPLDACTLGVPALCPASEGVVDISHTEWAVQSVVVSYLDLHAREDVTFRLGVNIYGEDERLHSMCVQTLLRSEESDGEGDGASFNGVGSSNTTASSGGSDSSNGTTSDGGTNSNDEIETQNSRGHRLRSAWYLSL